MLPLHHEAIGWGADSSPGRPAAQREMYQARWTPTPLPHDKARMNRAELVEAVRRELGREATRAEAERAVHAVLAAIGTGLRRHRNVQLVGFGTFKVAAREPRVGVHPQTGECIAVPASVGVRFAVGKTLRNQLRT